MKRDPDRLPWLDALKGAALLWIVLNHVSEAVWGGPHLANPTRRWPELTERFGQFAPLSGHGLWDVPLNLLRWLGWTGDQGVQLFLIASGFGLAWGLLAGRRPATAAPTGVGAASAPGAAAGTGAAPSWCDLPPLPLGWFFRRRVARVYPLWWGAHLLFLVPAFALGWGIFSLSKELLLSLAGLRVTPPSFYWAFPAWWFIGLLLQLYAVFPLLWAGLRRWGPGRLLAVCVVAGLAARAAVLLLLPGVDMWLRGAVFVTRLPEFALGVALAAWLARDRAGVDAWLRRPGTVALGALAWLAGMGLSGTWWGMTAAPLLLGAGAFTVLYAALGGRAGRGAGGGGGAREPAILAWAGRHSYALFLVHHPLIMLLLERDRPSVLGGALAVALTAPAALLLERGTAAAQARVAAWRERGGWFGAAVGAGLAGALIVAVVVAGEAAVRRFAPQEINGWGERPSLQPDARCGWKLIPDRTTRLRWLGYDYRVTANSLGFPGPEYPAAREPGAWRILVTGDAFTSAEGVDTELAWPRLLEKDLEKELSALAPGRRVEVLNFAVTGYGPNQYAAVVEAYAPVYRPDTVVIGLFGNDFQDVLVSNDDFRAGIGFGLPPAHGRPSWTRPHHLRRWFRLNVAGPVAERLRRRPDPNGWFLGQFALLERGRPDLAQGRPLATARLARIKAVADSLGATLALAVIPAPAQVCGPRDLAYWPRFVDLADSSRFDLDQPQRLAAAVAGELGVPAWDLRPALKAAAAGGGAAEPAGACPYQRRNLHWTAAGHRAAAAEIARRLAAALPAAAAAPH